MSDADKAVQDYISFMSMVGGVAIVRAVAEGTQDQSLLVQHGGHIELKKLRAKSLLGKMGYVNRK